jgi:tryptophanyl-tRNA synthetase
MRPTGQLHLGNYHGALKNWVTLQRDYRCFFFVADWHALTTDYDNTSRLQAHVRDMVIDWLAAGLDPDLASIFVQSQVPAHAELHLLLSMITPLSWLERVPTYKDQQAELKDRDLATYGFLGYPLLQSADILIYRPAFVPVGEDQVAHVEITREVARRFNNLFGRNGQAPRSDQHLSLRKQFQEGETRQLLPEPKVLLTPTPKVPGLDGRKMSKSYGNTIGLTEEPESITNKLKGMVTDPARVRRTDPGTPEKCPVWDLHKLYSSEQVRSWVREGCTTAGIGCLECKKPVIEKITAEATAMRERAQPYLAHPARVTEILAAGSRRANAAAEETMQLVRGAMNLLAGAAHS